jgi:hypothetical protein
MAKKLLHQDKITINKAENYVEIKGNYPLNSFLLVTDVTANKTLFQFNNSAFGATYSYSEALDLTTLYLTYDIANDDDIAENDKIQIFVEVEAQAFEPTEALLDAVGKLRVSNPANLIDTDFEYGLQSTKWETLQTVNNIPTVYSTSGDTPVEGIITVDAVKGSKQVRVVTNTPHNLQIGNPVSVQGLTDYQAEGYFSISGVPSATSFFFELDVPATSEGDISGSYTTIVPAKFFEGSPLNLNETIGAITDAAENSSITVTTNETHGFSPGTKVYLRNTVGPKRLQILDPTEALAPDGRPYVDTQSFFITTDNVNAIADTGRADYRAKTLVAYDWEPTYSYYINNVGLIAGNQITWPGHNLQDNYALLMNTPYKGQTNMGLDDGTVGYVKVIDEDTIELYTDYETLTSQLTLSAPDLTFGYPRFGLVYKIDRTSGNSRYTPYYVKNQVSGSWRGQEVGGFANSNFNTFYNIEDGIGGDFSSVQVTRVDMRGDMAASTEWVQVTYPDGTSTRGDSYADTDAFRTFFSGSKDLSAYITTQGGKKGLTLNWRSDPQVDYMPGSITNGWFWSAYVYFSASGGGSGALTDSGSDLSLYTYGLGLSNPTRIIAFQGMDPNNSSFTNNDTFSNLTNQRTNGRYGTISPQYSNVVTGTDATGFFNIDYNNGSTNAVSSNEIFYVFADVITVDRNTIYFQDHGIESGQQGSITVTTANYNAGERFAFSDSNGVTTVIDDQDIPVTFTAVSADLLKVQLDIAPNTDDIQQFPQSFEMNYRKNNALFNTVYVANHKITGTAEAQYQVEGLNEAAPTAFNVENSGVENYIFNSEKLPTDSSDPNLVVYRGLDYEFVLDAAGFEFYITTDDGTGYVEDSYVGEYTTNVSGSRTDVGTITWTVDASAPDTLYYRGNGGNGMGGIIEVRDQGTAIGGIVNDTIYNLTRVDDSRLSVSQTVSTGAVGTTAVVGAPNTQTTTQFVNLEAALGVVPTAATLTRCEYRGDFNGRFEYVLITFEDGESFFIGQREGQRTSIFVQENFFPQKDVTELLVSDGGAIGINVTFDPTSQINNAPGGMSNLWEIRFDVSGDSGSVVLGSGANGKGSGLSEFVVESLTGAYDGVFEITETPQTNSFIVQTDFTIPKRVFNLTSTEVDSVNNTIIFADAHNLIPGEEVLYNPGSDTEIMAVDSFVARQGIFNAIVVDENTIQLAESKISADNGVFITLSEPTTTHTLTSTNIIKNSAGEGSVTTVQGHSSIVGNGTSFLSTFKRFDKIYITETDRVREYVVDTITTDENLTVSEPVFSTNVDTPYFYPTQLMLRPDGFSLHKSFDGGVDITAGTSPNSKIVRQSRKYFRYQSGKGIQNSFAINFNPPKIVQQLIKAQGQYATVTTQEAHNLKVGDRVKIEGATVSYGFNTYNGTFPVDSIADDFHFTYDMGATPDQARAEGFPTYVRESWQDSYVRAGMFDDQNGFFYEYDGNKLYAVRRSSTLQLAGTINATRGSQIITGNNTSFTTQIFNGDMIVIRGQSYKVVEVSSDLRLVVQPAYRGVTATNVKITKTVDTRTPQEEFSIDRCDGTGPSGFVLNLNRIQMAYADYSWYGAGKIRYGFKDQNGHVVYVHEYKHNNKENESYFRSGNLPGRYEIENGPNASTAPTLFHFGTSIIMDGTFDDDKAYLLTANSRPFSFTNGSSFTANSTGISAFDVVTLNGSRVFVYSIPVSATDAAAVKVGTLVRDPSNTALPEGTYITQVKVDGANSKIFTSHPATGTEPSGASFPDIANGSVITLGETTAIELTQPIPLISIRLAPSVDSSLTGKLGEREIINRMQMALKQAGVTSNEDVEIFLILNALPSRLNFENVDKPSLSEKIEHVAGDTLQNGTTIYSLKASAGSVEIDLAEILELGNSILGGDGIFPAGPDLLTLAVQPQSTTGISASTPFFVTGKITWTESQA